MAAILASSSVAGLVGADDAAAFACIIAGPKPVGRAVSVRGWKNRFPGAAGTRFTITEVFLAIIKLSSKYSKRTKLALLFYSSNHPYLG